MKFTRIWLMSVVLCGCSVTLPVVSPSPAPVVVTNAPPVVVAPVMVVPTCRFVAVPVMNAWTGFTYLVTRRVCN